jgi:sporulation protein YlmC with PRC-barrel domain
MNFSSYEHGDASMRKLAYAAILFALATTAASAQSPQTAPKAVPEGPAAKILASIPANAMTVTHWYKQSVYDPSDAKVGEIMDVLVDRDGKIGVLIVGVGGFLGMGEKDVAVPFNAVQFKTKDNNKWYPVMNTTKRVEECARVQIRPRRNDVDAGKCPCGDSCDSLTATERQIRKFIPCLT